MGVPKDLSAAPTNKVPASARRLEQYQMDSLGEKFFKTYRPVYCAIIPAILEQRS